MRIGKRCSQGVLTVIQFFMVGLGFLLDLDNRIGSEIMQGALYPVRHPRNSWMNIARTVYFSKASSISLIFRAMIPSLEVPSALLFTTEEPAVLQSHSSR
jgi:hypothetical protein